MSLGLRHKISSYCQCHLLKVLEEKKVINFVSELTLRRLMSYIYMKQPFLMFLDHTKRRTTVGRTPLDE
jgi:hypothetical protein